MGRTDDTTGAAIDAAWLQRDEALEAATMAGRIHARGLTTAGEAIERMRAAIDEAAAADAVLVSLLALEVAA